MSIWHISESANSSHASQITHWSVDEARKLEYNEITEMIVLYSSGIFESKQF